MLGSELSLDVFLCFQDTIFTLQHTKPSSEGVHLITALEEQRRAFFFFRPTYLDVVVVFGLFFFLVRG